MKLTLVAAMDRNRAIGRGGDMPWHLPADLRHFKQVTLGHPVLMGRKTFESIGRPLPGRENLVLTRRRDYRAEGVTVLHDLQPLASRMEEIMVIGGGELYAQLLPRAQRMLLTRVDTEVTGADTFFPAWNEAEWQRVERVSHPADEHNIHWLFFEEWQRKS